MRDQLKVLLVGQPSRQLTELEALVKEHWRIVVSVHHLGDDPQSPSQPRGEYDTILLALHGDSKSDEWMALKPAIDAHANETRKPLLVVGPDEKAGLVLQAVNDLGARWGFILPSRKEHLIDLINDLADEGPPSSSTVTTFMNAKGGSGASFCAANYAHLLVKEFKRETLLLDVDLQFGSLRTYFNIDAQSDDGELTRALELVDTLDTTALRGYTQQYKDGPYLLASALGSLVLPQDVREEQIAKLFKVLDEGFEEVVVDLPRRIDQSTVAVLDRSDRVMLVTQQTVVHLQELKRVVDLLTGELEYPPERIIVLVNRHQRNAEIKLKDFEEALPELRIEKLPNDYSNVAKSINLGVPLLDHERRSPYCKALHALGSELVPRPEAPESARTGMLGWLSRSRHA